jgi:hypothetical protein
MTNLEFTELGPEHKVLFEKYTEGFAPYCDYSFSTQMNWSSPKHPTKVAIYKNNLVIQLKDFNTDKIVNLFIGKNDIIKSVTELLEEVDELSMIPEEIVKELLDTDKSESIYIEEDSVNYEYVLDLEKTATLKGRKLKQKRHRAKAFVRTYPEHTVEIVEKNHVILKDEIEQLILEWVDDRGIDKEMAQDEINAVKRLLEHAELFNLVIVCIRINGKLVAYTTNEIKGEMVHGGFGKALRKFVGIYSYLEQLTARHLLERGAKYINLEQDLGLDGLRCSKQTWRPIKILKKYTIRKKTNGK